MATSTVHATPIMLFGFHGYTATWSNRARISSDLAKWVHVPAKNLVTLIDTVVQFPKLEVLVLDVFNDLLLDSNPLDLSSSLSETVSGFYDTFGRVFEILPRLRVSVF